MSTRLFQSILLEVKNKVPFVLGVADSEGNIVSCTELRYIGERLESVDEFLRSGQEQREEAGRVFYRLIGFEENEEYAIFADETGPAALAVCAVCAIAIQNSKSLYDEKHDRVTFIKKIILDNILPGDIYIKSREMHFTPDAKRVVYFIRTEDKQDPVVVELLQMLYPDRQRDFAITVSENEVVLVKELKIGASKEIAKVAKEIDDALTAEITSGHVIGIGSCVTQLKDIARSFKEAQVSVEIGHVFNDKLTVMNFENLGVGRLIYQLPTTMCEMFLSEVFKKGSIESLDEETLFTIQNFFENNLNVSETARKLFVHRNTLVYRLEKIKKLTGLDLREFDSAIVLKVALMVKKYLASKENMA